MKLDPPIDENATNTRAQRIYRKLTDIFVPSFLDVQDESARHVGHAGSRPDGQTHYHVRMVSAAFKGQNKVARHRAVYAALADEMPNEKGEGGLHALSLDLRAEDEG